MGFVVGFSDKLILFHVVNMDAFRLNGYCAIQIEDVKAYRAFEKPQFWQSRAARRFKFTPVCPPGISLGSIPELITSIARGYPLFTCHPERTKPYVCYIGSLISATAATFTINDLDCDAEWTGPRRLRFRDITRVEFGGGYEEALAATAPKCPKRKK